MKKHSLSRTLPLALLLSSVVSCSKDDAKEAPPAAEPPGAAAAAATEKPDEPKPEPAAPRDPRIVELFEKGKDCTWNEQGMTDCPAAKEIKKLAFENQGSSELAASCAGALTDPSLSVRGLAAACMDGFNDKARTPHLGAGLDAFEAEKDPGLRRALAWAFKNGNASEAGVEPRVIALVESLADNPDTQIHASYFFGTMFPQYLMGTTRPTKEAGDFAIKLAKTGTGPLHDTAVDALGLLTDRADEVCPLLRESTTAETWTRTVPPMAKVGGPCLTDLDPVVDLIAESLSKGNFFATQSGALRQLLRKASLSPAQVAKLKKASKKNVAASKGAHSDSAKKLDAEIKAYKDPAAQ